MEHSQLTTLLQTELPEMDAPQLNRLSTYVALVGEYSRIMNLTGARGQLDIAMELVVDALKLQLLGEIAPGANVVDLGSGNGSPVVPLAVCSPTANFTAVESRMKRSSFLERVKVALQLDNLEVKHQRAEEVAAESPKSFDIVTSRAFAETSLYLELAKQLVRKNGAVWGFSTLEETQVQELASKAGHGLARYIQYQNRPHARAVYCVVNAKI